MSLSCEASYILAQCDTYSTNSYSMSHYSIFDCCSYSILRLWTAAQECHDILDHPALTYCWLFTDLSQ